MRILDVDEASPREAAALTPHLADGEEVLAAFASPTGAILFTERRLIVVQPEHLLEEKVETTSWPWREVKRFAIQEGEARTAVRIWLGGDDHPLHLRADSGGGLIALQRLLAERVG
ncbi:MAG: PH domain-containing protein [Allosphingosinicella sp.]